MKLADNPRAAFTLLEFLIVSGLLVLLAFLLAPVLGKIREASKDATNISNLKQLGAAMLAYAGEHNGKMPETLQAIVVDGKPSKGIFYTNTIDCYSEGSVRRLFSAANWPGFGTGSTDYLSNPDVLYSPWTPTLNQNRQKGQPYAMTPTRFRIGYGFYFLPLSDSSALNPSEGETRHAKLDPTGRPITNAFLPTAHPHAPLFADISAKTWADDTGYPWIKRRIVHTVWVDGSVHAVPCTINGNFSVSLNTLIGY